MLALSSGTVLLAWLQATFNHKMTRTFCQTASTMRRTDVLTPQGRNVAHFTGTNTLIQKEWGQRRRDEDEELLCCRQNKKCVFTVTNLHLFIITAAAFYLSLFLSSASATVNPVLILKFFSHRKQQFSCRGTFTFHVSDSLSTTVFSLSDVEVTGSFYYLPSFFILFHFLFPKLQVNRSWNIPDTSVSRLHWGCGLEPVCVVVIGWCSIEFQPKSYPESVFHFEKV